MLKILEKTLNKKRKKHQIEDRIVYFGITVPNSSKERGDKLCWKWIS